MSIPLYTHTTPGWRMSTDPPAYAVGIDVGMNEYTFGRTTPDNKFVVSTGLENNPRGIEMIGGGKRVQMQLSDIKKYYTHLKKNCKIDKKGSIKLKDIIEKDVWEDFSKGKYKKDDMIQISKIMVKINKIF